MMDKNKFIDSLILLILLIGVSTFPVNLLVSDPLWYYVIEALMMVAVFLFILIFERRHPEDNPYLEPFNLKNLLILLPCLIAVLSNFLYAWILKEEPHPVFYNYHIPQIAFIVFNVIVEEYVFRKHLLGNLRYEKKIMKIFISALIFGLCHLTLFLSTFNPASLIVVAYSFGLGMILGFIYCYTNSLIACIIYHALFNLLNDFLFENIYMVNNALWYYLVNVFVAIIVGLYLLAIYFFILEKIRKKPSITRLN